MSITTHIQNTAPETIKNLYGKIDATKLLFEMKDRGHGYNRDFDRLMLSFVTMYA